MDLGGFGPSSGPRAPPLNAAPVFGISPPISSPPPPPPYPSPSPIAISSPNPSPRTPPRQQQSPPRPQRPFVPPTWDSQPRRPVNFSYTMSPQKSYPIPSSSNTRDAEANNSMKPHNPSVMQTTTSPSLLSCPEDILGLYSPPNANGRRLATPPSLSGQLKEPVSLPSMHNQRLSPSPAHGNAPDTMPHQTNSSDFQVPKRTRSPPLPSRQDDFQGTYHYNAANAKRVDDRSKRIRFPAPASSHSVQNLEFSGQIDQRHDVSPPRGGNQRKSPVPSPTPKMSQVVASSSETLLPLRPACVNSPERARSPPSQSDDASFFSSSISLDSDREMHAKAKRLARFNVELSKSLQTPIDLVKQKFSGNKNDQALSDRNKSADGPAEEASYATGASSDYEGMTSSKVVVGQCPDMCPESEREERERKGDLDKFERLDGERNQTTKFLAVKKYTRTAEREAELIRPLPILRKTVDYLLNLLDLPYDENFLGIYNFLWDRMRAVRMDLRMQHIFNEEAILMLEQMIRLHIIAMHELCEYKKGEGFTEGFDAHLNIEQMNKTSVELFQMYEDHRKRGKTVSTEKEFRGYYALLKLDKHPGYKVEPSALSLDLAKMTPEMRSTPEILFARAVARACRIGNFIAFFRLARKATYLQACLMHAHFAKVRAQALASLHSGLQSNQGIPISHVVKWLGMEGEDIEGLLEYHGFALRSYGELYMVKEGPFLNSDKDFPTMRSLLVHLKKSTSIVDDVGSVSAVAGVTIDEVAESVREMTDLKAKTSKKKDRINVVDEEFKVESVENVIFQPEKSNEVPLQTIPSREDDHELTDVSFDVWNGESDHLMTEASPGKETSLPEDNFVSDQEQFVDKKKTVGFVIQDVPINKSAWANLERSYVQAAIPASPAGGLMVADPIPYGDPEENIENEASVHVSHQEEEASRENLKLILRKWKERSSVLRQIREQRELVASAALSSLTLGPPVRRQSGMACVTEELNMDYVTRERLGRLGKSWARLNVAELVAPILSTRNPDAKCLSWKLVLLAQSKEPEGQTYDLVLKWLRSKVMGCDAVIDDDLLVCSPGLSIWKTWIDNPEVCCLSILREARLGGNHGVCDDDHTIGSSCLLFLASGTISWDIQRVQLHKILMSIPSGASVPLLILYTDPYEESIADPSVTVIDRLGLQVVDNTRISSLSVIFLNGGNRADHSNSFFDDVQLKEGLQWLANNSPLQPVVQLVRTHELALGHVRHSIAVIDNLAATEVGPDHCVEAFNEALDRAAEEIVAAASRNPNCWPSPEIDLLDKSSDERVVAELNLPCVGWSLAERIEPVIRAINSCKLPSFPNDMSWLKAGAPSGWELERQKMALEECLFNYLTDSTRLLNPNLAATEATVMLQKGAHLELRGSCHYIVPRWAVIFQRIYNWQLTRLKGKEISGAYVLVQKDEMGISNVSDAVSISELTRTGMKEDYQQLHSYETDISLDELVQVSCDVPFSGEPRSVSKPSPRFIQEEELNPSEIDVREPEDSHDDQSSSEFACDVSSREERYEQQALLLSAKSLNKLEMLVEEVTSLQDKIDERLYIFF